LRLVPRLAPENETRNLPVVLTHQCQHPRPMQRFPIPLFRPVGRFRSLAQNHGHRRCVPRAKRTNRYFNALAPGFRRHASSFPSRKFPRPTAARNLHPGPVLPRNGPLPIPRVQCAQSSVLARSKRTLLFPAASLALSTPLRKQRTPHPPKPIQCFHHFQILPQLQQISPVPSPSRHPTALGPSPPVDRSPRTPDLVVHLQTPPLGLFPLRPPLPILVTARPPQFVFRNPPPK